MAASEEDLLAAACRKNAWRLLVILAIAYVVNYLDRNSIAYAGLTMNKALGLTARQFGLAAGLTTVSYALLEIPSNLFMQRVGARLWLSRIMISWGVAAGAGALVIGPVQPLRLEARVGCRGGRILPRRLDVPVHLVPLQLPHARLRVVPAGHTGILADRRSRGRLFCSECTARCISRAGNGYFWRRACRP